jgi:glycine oxidase
MKAGIAGAGILGKLLAYELSRAGYAVTLFDQRKNSEMQNCSMAAAGLLTPITELERCGEEIYSLGISALKTYWPEITNEINAADDFQYQGSLVLAHPNDESEKQRMTAIIDRRLSAEKKYTSINQAEILALEPELNKWHSAFYFKDEGCLDNISVLKKLEHYLIKKNIEIKYGEHVKNVSANTVVTESGELNFDWVFDCRGLGGKQYFADVRGIRGEAILLHAPEVKITRPVRILNPKYSLYIVPKKNNHYVLGASEIESEDMSNISVRTTLELLSSAYYVHPGFSEARIVKNNTQARPTLSDHLPKLKYTKGMVAINGLYRHGFLIAPTLAKDVMDFINKGISSVAYPDLWEEMHA